MNAERFLVNALPPYVPLFLVKPQYVAALLARNAEPDPTA